MSLQIKVFLGHLKSNKNISEQTVHEYKKLIILKFEYVKNKSKPRHDSDGQLILQNLRKIKIA